jgi:hypothetical protein
MISLFRSFIFIVLMGGIITSNARDMQEAAQAAAPKENKGALKQQNPPATQPEEGYKKIKTEPKAPTEPAAGKAQSKKDKGN